MQTNLDLPFTDRDTSKDYYASVSRILEATESAKDKGKLNAWRQRVGAAEADLISENSKARGHAFHQQTELYAARGNSELPALDDYLSQFDRIGLSESWVYHDELEYKGRLDNTLIWNDQLCVLDWKTALKEKRKTWMKRAGTQLAAYAKGLEAMHGVTIFCGLIVNVIGTQEDFLKGELVFQEFMYTKTEMNAFFEEFKKRLAKYKKIKQKQTISK